MSPYAFEPTEYVAQGDCLRVRRMPRAFELFLLGQPANWVAERRASTRDAWERLPSSEPLRTAQDAMSVAILACENEVTP